MAYLKGNRGKTMIPKSADIGKRFEDLICEDCKLKIAEKTKGIKKYHMLMPRKIGTDFMKVVCRKCKHKIIVRLKNGV